MPEVSLIGYPCHWGWSNARISWNVFGICYHSQDFYPTTIDLFEPHYPKILMWDWSFDRQQLRFSFWHSEKLSFELPFPCEPAICVQIGIFFLMLYNDQSSCFFQSYSRHRPNSRSSPNLLHLTVLSWLISLFQHEKWILSCLMVQVRFKLFFEGLIPDFLTTDIKEWF